MQHLEGAYNFDKEIRERGIFQWKTQGNFFYEIKEFVQKNHGVFFNVTQLTRVKNEKFRFSKLYLIKKLKVQVQMTWKLRWKQVWSKILFLSSMNLVV